MLLAVDPADVNLYPSAQFTKLTARTTVEAVRQLETLRPRVAVIDWDLPGLDSVAICRAAGALNVTSILVTCSAPEQAPAAIKAGCHGVLLKPFAPNLAAGRIGRLVRESMYVRSRGHLHAFDGGTNRLWPDTACAHCGTGGAVSFEFYSHRRMWYACLSCNQVWLGARQE